MSEEKTKKCKHCKMDIPKDAKICPHCRKKQKSGILKWVVLILKHKGYLRNTTATIASNNLLSHHGNIRGSDYFQ